jgi:hypothetical protein
MNKDKQIGRFNLDKDTIDKFFPKKDIDIFGYESPINVLIGQMRMEQEGNIFKVVQEHGIDVDKEELIKALQYDRNQYEKGYINGYNAKAADVAREIIDDFDRHGVYSKEYTDFLRREYGVKEN